MTRGLNTKIKWVAVTKGDMDSDHSPIVLEMKNSDVQTSGTLPSRARWRTKDIDWASFRKEIEENISEEPLTNLSQRVSRFNDLLLQAGNKHVTKTKPSRTVKFTMNPRVKALVRKRNHLRLEVKTKRKEWLEAVAEARIARAEAKDTAWSAFVESLEYE